MSKMKLHLLNAYAGWARGGAYVTRKFSNPFSFFHNPFLSATYGEVNIHIAIEHYMLPLYGSYIPKVGGVEKSI